MRDGDGVGRGERVAALAHVAQDRDRVLHRDVAGAAAGDEVETRLVELWGAVAGPVPGHLGDAEV